ncbi:hypothetical protein ABT093_09935 [Kitasatospora sp. NPDC002551]|uniref:hypothetical protein n=1 Tax=Kitasatospora sp. NPDC002551 TaxID=3154539 RepID=UPI003326E1A2
MPWFKIDDGFHCHTKVFAAGTAAVGLYVRCGSWAAQQTSEGIIPRAVARQYGTPRMIKALVEAGLWHEAPHDCDACREWHPTIPANTFLIHEYLAYNPSKEAVAAARAAKTERQKRWRDGKRKGASDTNPNGNSHEVDANPNEKRNGFGGDSDASWDAESEHASAPDAENGQVSGGSHSDVDASTRASRNRRGDAAPIPARPVPSPLPPTEVELASKAARSGGPQVPDFARDLVDQMTAAGMVVGWRLGDTEWFAVHGHIKRCGTAALVEFARRRWNPDDPPQTARYLTRIWSDLPDMPQPEAGLPALRSVTGAPAVSRQQQQTDDMFTRAMARAQERMQQKESS